MKHWTRLAAAVAGGALLLAGLALLLASRTCAFVENGPMMIGRFAGGPNYVCRYDPPAAALAALAAGSAVVVTVAIGAYRGARRARRADLGGLLNHLAEADRAEQEREGA